MASQIIFIFLTLAGIALFVFNMRKVIRNIKIGKAINRSDQPAKRLMTMLKVAFGQTKMAARPIPFLLHLIVYLGFVIINLEVLEIIIDGAFGTHRVFAGLGGLYDFLIGSFEFLAIGVWLACVIFLIRRNILKIKRFSGVEMTSWPKSDANYILITEILLMSAFLIMNAADAKLQALGEGHYISAGSFPISVYLQGLLPNSAASLIIVERACWWFHIVGIFAFLNYLPYSKHFHILLAFPNTYFSNLEPKGEFTNMQSVTNEVKAMLDPSFVPAETAPGKFGAKDVNDLSWVNLMNAYTCTECGRCSIGIIKSEAEPMGYTVFIVPGSSFIERIIKEQHFKAVVGIACYEDLNLMMMNLSDFAPQGVLLTQDGCFLTKVNVKEVLDKIGYEKQDQTKQTTLT